MRPKLFCDVRHLAPAAHTLLFVPCDVFRSLIASLVLICIDCENTARRRISTRLVIQLQSVLNAVARTVVALRQRDHVAHIGPREPPLA